MSEMWTLRCVSRTLVSWRVHFHFLLYNTCTCVGFVECHLQRVGPQTNSINNNKVQCHDLSIKAWEVKVWDVSKRIAGAFLGKRYNSWMPYVACRVNSIDVSNGEIGILDTLRIPTSYLTLHEFLARYSVESCMTLNNGVATVYQMQMY